jgi:hypothetical protein
MQEIFPSEITEFAGARKRTFVFAAFIAFLGSCAMACLFATSGLKLILLSVALAVTVPMLMVLPIQSAVILYFGYLSVDGAIKINTNYNPIFHVAQDLLMMLLFFRSCYGGEKPGVAKFFTTPFIGLGVIFVGWILLQYINPFGLGILPSIAGTKVYLSMLILFLMIYHHVPREKSQIILRAILLLATLQGVLAITEYLIGQDFVMGLNPHYREAIEKNYSGAYYRPFGTTTMPGGPSVWIMLAAPLSGYFLQKRDGWFFDKLLSIAFLAVSLPCLMVCQVRTAMLVSIGGFLFSFARPSAGLFLRMMGASMLAAFFAFMLIKFADSNTNDSFAWTSHLSQNQKEVLFNRMSTLNNKKTFQNARMGAFDSSMGLADKTMLGIGLSRVGSAAAVWTSIINVDPYFGIQWSFADNLYKAIFTELGIFGLISWLIMNLSFICVALYRSIRPNPDRDHNLLWVMGTSNAVLLLSGLGSEGILYNPVSAVFWAFQAIAAKEAFHERLT